MTLVVDASVFCKWTFRQPGHDAATRLFLAGESLIAPQLIIAEVCNAAWRLTVTGSATAAQAEQAIMSVQEVMDDLVALPPLARQALAIASALQHPAYDCFYVALAERERAPLVTDDKRLLGAVRRTEWAKLVRALE